MEEQKQFYESKVFAIRDKEINTVIFKTNKFMENRFIVGVQQHYIDNEWIFIVSYKVKPEVER